MKEITNDREERFIKAAIYGPPGTGKTSFGVTSPNPLILLSERQGLPHIKAAAARLGIATPRTLFMDSLGDYRAVIRGLMGCAGKPTLTIVNEKGAVLFTGAYPSTVVIDSLSDACRLVSEEVMADAPPQKASDGLDKVSERHWAALRDRSEKLIRAFRNVPAHVLFLCLADDKTTGEGDQQTRTVTPSLTMRALPGFLCASVNVVGITTREIGKDRDENGDRAIEFGVRTMGPSYFMLKPYRPLRDSEVPNFSSWVERLMASWDAHEAAQATAAADAALVAETRELAAKKQEAEAAADKAVA